MSKSEEEINANVLKYSKTVRAIVEEAHALIRKRVIEMEENESLHVTLIGRVTLNLFQLFFRLTIAPVTKAVEEQEPK